MTCGENFHSGSCICDLLADIAAAQQDDPNCHGSCSESIRELMAGLPSSGFNTIPIQLICGTSNNIGGNNTICGTVFRATGFRREPGNPTQLQTATSTFFRVDSVDCEKRCAVLELLCLESGDIPQIGGRPGGGGGQANDTNECPTDTTAVFKRTGVCVTVDCSCFCSAVCLPAMNLQRI
jgi:hypothetical protein